MTWQRWSVIPIWILALLGGIAVAVFAGDEFLTWLAVVLGVLVLLTAVIQLSIQRKEGLVTRMIASSGGAIVVLAAVTLVLAVLHPDAVLLAP